MSDINYREKYEKISCWVSKVIEQTNELYKTLSEQIILLIEENDQLRINLDKEKRAQVEIVQLIDEKQIATIAKEVEANKKNIKIDTEENKRAVENALDSKINNSLNED